MLLYFAYKIYISAVKGRKAFHRASAVQLCSTSGTVIRTDKIFQLLRRRGAQSFTLEEIEDPPADGNRSTDDNSSTDAHTAGAITFEDDGEVTGPSGTMDDPKDLDEEKVIIVFF